jgi:dihydroorotate dehydrogenase
MEAYYIFRANLIEFLYKNLLKTIFFKFDPESVHDSMLNVGTTLGRFSFSRRLTGKLFLFEDKILEQEINGLVFSNPIGLSAGFDKDGVLVKILPSVGFGFAEIGSVTARAYEGNQGTRLWRLKNSKSLGVWYGLKNQGSKVVAERVRKSKEKVKSKMLVGLSVAMTNCKENLDIPHAVSDYAEAFRDVESVADYITINISCPNTLGGQPFMDSKNYDDLMTEIDKIKTDKMIFVKISPDMTDEQVNQFLEVTFRHRVHGIICSNLTKKFNKPEIKDATPPHGGLSGKVVYPYSLKLLSYIYNQTNDRINSVTKQKLLLVFCGGVFSAQDAYTAIRQGANLIQMITGMIYEGPQVVGEINRGLVKLLKRDGFRNIKEAVGVDK